MPDFGSARENVTRQGWQVANLILPLRRIGSCPDQHEGLDNRTQRRELRYQKNAGARLAFLQAAPKMIHHRPPIMRDQDAALAGGNLQDIGIWNPFEFAVRGGREVDGRLSPPDGDNDW